MSKKNNNIAAPKPKIHPRSKHRERYDFDALTTANTDLKPFVKPNIHGDNTIDFANPEAVKALNKSLLQHYYAIKEWDIPENYLCPPIPGRADYMHHVADLLSESNYGKIPAGEKVICLDIGVGANCIYPLIGHREYGWSFIGADIDPIAVKSAQEIVEKNALQNQIEIRLQKEPKDYLYGVIMREDRVDFTVCNPPFHASLDDALKGSLRKVNNLNEKKVTKPTLNFGGQANELWCEGGEKQFILDLIRESKKFSTSCFWFTCLISKQSNLKVTYKALEAAGATLTKTLHMGQGNKSSRVIAWTFLSQEEQREWRDTRWNKKKKD